MQESHTLYGRIPPPTGVLSLQEFAFTLSERDWSLVNQAVWKKMADDDDGNRRKPENPRTPDSSREGTPDWKETCIGVWSRSTKGSQVTEAEPDKICNGISFVVINKVSLMNSKV